MAVSGTEGSRSEQDHCPSPAGPHGLSGPFYMDLLELRPQRVPDDMGVGARCLSASFLHAGLFLPAMPCSPGDEEFLSDRDCGSFGLCAQKPGTEKVLDIYKIIPGEKESSGHMSMGYFKV